MRKWFAILACSTVLAVGPCVIDEWKFAIGPVFNGETVYGGVEFEFANGFDFIVPIGPLND